VFFDYVPQNSYFSQIGCALGIFTVTIIKHTPPDREPIFMKTPTKSNKSSASFMKLAKFLSFSLCLGLFSPLLVGEAPARAHHGRSTKIVDLTKLTIAPERGSGYKRSLFPHWDEDSKNCSVREKVLISESLKPVQVDPKTCSVVSGSWFSLYDGLTLSSPSSIDIDHVVSLKEAWDSGAWSWTTDKRRLFANDLSSEFSLRAVSAKSNRSKSDKDPASWLPVPQARCQYLYDYVKVKTSWGLSVDKAELAALEKLNASCSTKDLSPTTPSSPSTSTVGTTSPSNNQAGSTYYATCADARASGAAPLYKGAPGYRESLDRDKDGVACE
jgi:hypothetical protein